MPKKPARSNTPMQRTITPELIRAALACIPPDLDRTDWARVGMAIKSELSDAAGFDLWNEWSARGESYNERNARDTWRSIKAGGATTIGTLFGIAKDHGFKFPEGTEPAPTPDPAALAEAERLSEKKRKQREAEEATYSQRADQAAREAAKLWQEAGESGHSPYLVRKRVQGHGVRYQPDGTLLVPMVTVSPPGQGVMQNVQRIAPEKPADGGTDKRFMPGGRKTGLWHLMGTINDAAPLLLAEGYATAASLHEATGHPVGVCWDAGNLVHVAKAVRQLHPTTLLMVCGDDDGATEQNTGTNPGRVKGIAAARAALTDTGPAGVVFPECPPDTNTDFNDMAQAAGLDAVRELVAAALAAPSIPKGRGKADGGTQRTKTQPTNDASAREDAPVNGDDAAPGYDPFSVNDNGVWHAARDADGNEKRPVWLCSRLVVTARTRAEDNNGWGFLLNFSDPDGNPKVWAMPSAMLSGDGTEWAGNLRNMGLQMAPGTRARNLLAQYIDTRRPEERVTCTDRVGWHDAVYVLPSGSIVSEAVQASGKRYVFQSESGMENTFRRQGSLADWQSRVASQAAGNSRLVFALCCAFAGPLVRLAELESGGFHLRGSSSMGKTVALRVASSVWGRPGYMQRWRSTANALEATAVQHCDATLILDEFGQLDPREAGNVAYLLANDQEKGRATGRGLSRKKRTWRLLFLSSGEVTLADQMAEAGQRSPRAGQEVRMVDVPMDAGAGMGGIEALHDHDTAKSFVEAIEKGAAAHYGHVGRLWLQWLCDHYDELKDRLRVLLATHQFNMVPEAASNQVERVGKRFALLAAAGELATEAGLTGWTPTESSVAITQVFNAWLGARGHLGNGEDAVMIRRVRSFLELNGEGRFAWSHRALDDHNPKTLNRAGFRRLLTKEGKVIRSDSDHQQEFGERITAADAADTQVDFIILREVFENEVCRGLDFRLVASLLRARGHLQVDGKRLHDRQRLPGMGDKKIPCYCIKPTIFEDEL
ncbi:MAG: DUF927 domain-containing protein [Rhizobacter sp.]